MSQEISDPEARVVAIDTHVKLVAAAGSEDGVAALEADKLHHATPEVRPPAHAITWLCRPAHVQSVAKITAEELD